jgi:hypothetical protein
MGRLGGMSVQFKYDPKDARSLRSIKFGRGGWIDVSGDRRKSASIASPEVSSSHNDESTVDSLDVRQRDFVSALSAFAKSWDEDSQSFIADDLPDLTAGYYELDQWDFGPARDQCLADCDRSRDIFMMICLASGPFAGYCAAGVFAANEAVCRQNCSRFP